MESEPSLWDPLNGVARSKADVETAPETDWQYRGKYVKRFNGFNRPGKALYACGAEYEFREYIMQCEKSENGSGIFRRFCRLDLLPDNHEKAV